MLPEGPRVDHTVNSIDKKRTLGGWTRLWIFVSILWLVLVSASAVIVFDERIEHSESHYQEMNANARQVAARLRPVLRDVVDDTVTNPFLEELVRRELGVMREVGDSAGLVFRPPAGVTVDDPEFVADVETVTVGYQTAFRRLQYQERLGYVGRALAVWLVPCVIVFVLGRAIGWVYQGFTKPPAP